MLAGRVESSTVPLRRSLHVLQVPVKPHASQNYREGGRLVQARLEGCKLHKR